MTPLKNLANVFVSKSRSPQLARSSRREISDLNSLSKISGFTLIELLVVIVVIGILATLVVANFSSSRSRARDIKRKNDLNSMKTALRLYYNDFQTYPAANGGRIAGCGANGTSACAWGSIFSAGTTTYMSELVADPLNNSPYLYTYAQRNTGDGFTITAVLENASDTDSTASQNHCAITPVVANNYVVCED
ncbi:MAG: type II secretion system protein [Patescibacteria group bacterium]